MAEAKEVVVKKAVAKKVAPKAVAEKKSAAVAVEKAPAKKVAKTAGAMVKVTLVKSVIGRIEAHKATIKGLGLRRMHQTVELQETPAIRGMINAVGYLLKVEA